MKRDEIIESNKTYWNDHADLWFGTTALPVYGVRFPTEDDLDVPKEFFDYVYSIYGIGWTTDLQGTFDKIASYLKKDGIFIFSWHHTLNYCVAWSCDERKEVFEDNKLVMTKVIMMSLILKCQYMMVRLFCAIEKCQPT